MALKFFSCFFSLILISSPLAWAEETSEDTMPSVEDANAGARPFNHHICGSEEEFIAKLNFLNDVVLCQTAASFAECATLMGAAGAGSIAALRAARASAAMSGDRPQLCRIGSSLQEKPFEWEELFVQKAYANRNCVMQAEQAAYRARNYVDNGYRQLQAALAREDAAMAAMFDGRLSNDVATDVFRRAPSTQEGFDAYINYMRQAVSDPSLPLDDASRAGTLDYIDYMRERSAGGNLASAWSDIRLGVQGRIGDVTWDLERQMGARYAQQVGADNARRLAEIRDIIMSRGPAAAPGAMSEDSRRRLNAFKAANPDLVPLIDDAIESRTARSVAYHQSIAYRDVLRQLNDQRSRARLVANPTELRNLIAGLQHFDFTGAHHQRFLVGSALGDITVPGQHGRLTNAGLRMTSGDFRGPLPGRLSEARRAMIASGSMLSRRLAAAGTLALGVATGGVATAAEAILTPSQLACADMRSQFAARGNDGCGNTVDINNPLTQTLLTLPPEFAMREAADDVSICEVVNSLAAANGPESYQASCESGSGFTISSRRGVRDLRLHAVYGSRPGEITQVNLSGQQMFGAGGIMGLRFQNDQFTEALIPVEGGQWLQAMQTDPEGTLDFQTPDTFTPLPRSDVENHQTTGSIVGREAMEALQFVASRNAMITEVSTCCTGVGSPGPERCQQYGITGSRSPAPASGVDTSL